MKGMGAYSAIAVAVGFIISILAMKVIVGIPTDLARGDSLSGASGELKRIAKRIDQVCKGDSTQGSVNIEIADGSSIIVEGNTLALSSSSTEGPNSITAEHCSQITGVGGSIEHGGTFTIEIKKENEKKIAELSRG